MQPCIKGSEKACRRETSFTLFNPILPQTTKNTVFSQNVGQCLSAQLWEMPSTSVSDGCGVSRSVKESRPRHSCCPLWTLPTSLLILSSLDQERNESKMNPEKPGAMEQKWSFHQLWDPKMWVVILLALPGHRLGGGQLQSAGLRPRAWAWPGHQPTLGP